MSPIISDFPVFENNPELIYLDSAATLMKPQMVIDGVSQYLSHDYANIHRGKYDISMRSEEIYRQARKNVATFMGTPDEEEVIFTANSTDSTNILVRSLIRSGIIQKNDEILLSSLEHHANVLPWMLLAEQTGAKIIYIDVGADGLLDPDACIDLISSKTKIIALTLCSNVTGILRDQEITKIASYIGETYPPDSILGSRPLLVVDASQYIVHHQLSIHTLGVDFCFWTGHKLGALTGIGILRGKNSLLKQLPSGKVGGGAIQTVSRSGVVSLGSPDKFEPGTPNIAGALSLDLAIRYICGLGSSHVATPVTPENIAFGYAYLNDSENSLIEYCLEQFHTYQKNGKLTLLGSQSARRIGVFSFVVHDIAIGKISQAMQDAGIAMRVGAHCAHIYHQELGSSLDRCEEGCVVQTCRISLRGYTRMSDVEKFWEIMDTIYSTI